MERSCSPAKRSISTAAITSSTEHDGPANLHCRRSPEGWHRCHHSGHSERRQEPPLGSIQEPRPGIGLPALLQPQGPGTPPNSRELECSQPTFPVTDCMIVDQAYQCMVPPSSCGAQCSAAVQYWIGLVRIRADGPQSPCHESVVETCAHQE